MREVQYSRNVQYRHKTEDVGNMNVQLHEIKEQEGTTVQCSHPDINCTEEQGNMYLCVHLHEDK
jgi:hypothetical protein